MGRRRTNNYPSKNLGRVENLPNVDLGQLIRDGGIKDGELTVYDKPISACGLVGGDLRHGPQYRNEIVFTINGVQRRIALKCRRTNFGGYRWYMVDSKDRLHEKGYLWGDHYASRQDIGVINYASQGQPRWSRLQRQKRRVECEIEALRGQGKVAARRRRQLQDEHWQLEVDCERAIEGDAAPMLESILTGRQTRSRRQASSQQRLKLFERAMQYNPERMAEDVIIARYEPDLRQMKSASTNRHFAIRTGTSKTAKVDPVAEVDIRFLRRLGHCNPGALTGRELGWPPGWLQREGRRVFFLIDRRVSEEDCALFVTHDGGQPPVAQFFWIREGKGAFDRPQLFFRDPHRDDVADRLRFSHSGFRYCTDEVPEGDDWDFALAEQEAERLQPPPERELLYLDGDVKIAPRRLQDTTPTEAPLAFGLSKDLQA